MAWPEIEILTSLETDHECIDWKISFGEGKKEKVLSYKGIVDYDSRIVFLINVIQRQKCSRWGGSRETAGSRVEYVWKLVCNSINEVKIGMFGKFIAGFKRNLKALLL